jgi:hypothetical protein
LGLSNKLNFRLLDTEKFRISNKFKITSIPRYMLINEDGKIIDSDAARPSNTKIRKNFDDLLKNNYRI